jgi:(p)ppGpp synthase/HD superfamily hydrolase
MHVIVQDSGCAVSGDGSGSSIVRAALEFATARHAGQCREVDGAPFINHPMEVGRLLDRDGQPGEVVAAGLLHDLLEKTATTAPELRCRFGVRVARLVESVSADPSICDHAARKRELRDRVAHGGSGTVAIFTADKISKARELALLSPSQLHRPDARAKLDHYVASLEMLRRVNQGGALDDRLDAELTRLVRAVARSARRAAGDSMLRGSTAVELS